MRGGLIQCAQEQVSRLCSSRLAVSQGARLQGAPLHGMGCEGSLCKPVAAGQLRARTRTDTTGRPRLRTTAAEPGPLRVGERLSSASASASVDHATDRIHCAACATQLPQEILARRASRPRTRLHAVCALPHGTLVACMQIGQRRLPRRKMWTHHEANDVAFITELHGERGDGAALSAVSLAYHLVCSSGRTPAVGGVVAFVPRSFVNNGGGSVGFAVVQRGHIIERCDGRTRCGLYWERTSTQPRRHRSRGRRWSALPASRFRCWASTPAARSWPYRGGMASRTMPSCPARSNGHLGRLHSTSWSSTREPRQRTRREGKVWIVRLCR